MDDHKLASVYLKSMLSKSVGLALRFSVEASGKMITKMKQFVTI